MFTPEFMKLLGRLADNVSFAMEMLEREDARRAAEQAKDRLTRMPVNDFMTKNGSIRDDGRMMRDMYLLQTKKPSESKGEWDLMNVAATIPAEVAYRSLADPPNGAEHLPVPLDGNAGNNSVSAAHALNFPDLGLARGHDLMQSRVVDDGLDRASVSFAGLQPEKRFVDRRNVDDLGLVIDDRHGIERIRQQVLQDVPGEIDAADEAEKCVARRFAENEHFSGPGQSDQHHVYLAIEIQRRDAPLARLGHLGLICGQRIQTWIGAHADRSDYTSRSVEEKHTGNRGGNRIRHFLSVLVEDM